MAYALNSKSTAYDLASILARHAAPPAAQAGDWQASLTARLQKSGYDVRPVQLSAEEVVIQTSEMSPHVTCQRNNTGELIYWLVGQRGREKTHVWRFDVHGMQHWQWTAAQLHTALNGESMPLLWLRAQPVLLLTALHTAGSQPHALHALQRLAALVLTERATMGWILFYAVATGLLALTLPVVVQTLVNTVAFTAILQPLIILTVLLAAGLSYGATVRCLQVVVVEHLQRRLFVRISTDLQRRIPALEKTPQQRALLVHRFFEVNNIQKAAASLLLGGLEVVLQTGIGVIILAFYHPWMLAIDSLLVLSLAGVFFGLGRHALQTGINESDAKYQVAASLHASATDLGIPGHGKAAQEAVEGYLTARMAHFKILFGQYVSCAALGVILSVVLLGVGGWLVLGSQLSLGQLVAAEFIITSVAAGVTKLSRYLETFYALATGVEKLGKIIDQPLNVDALAAQPPARWPLSLPVSSSSLGRWASWSLYAIPLLLVGLLATPWWQTARADGRVIAFAPVEREQFLEAPIEGRVVNWSVQEGSHVRQGDHLVDLNDNDSNLPARLEGELRTLEAQLKAARGATGNSTRNIDSMIRARDLGVAAADARVRTAEHRRDSASRALEAALATQRAASLNLERQRALTEQGLSSTRTFELTEAAYATALGEVEKARAAESGAVSDILALEADRQRVAASGEAEVERAEAALQGARSTEAKLEAEIIKLQTRRSRQAAMTVVAPRDGTILRIEAPAGTGIVKAGDPLAVFVPDAAAEAVELWVDGRDAPLISPGRTVRLQFEGWPAVQFAGWPQVAVGTFAGQVRFIDAAARTDGRLRLMVVPLEPGTWPQSPYLRQGVRAHAWIILNRVTVGYEMWRQINNFPIAPGYDAQPASKKKPRKENKSEEEAKP